MITSKLLGKLVHDTPEKIAKLVGDVNHDWSNYNLEFVPARWLA